MLHSTHIKEQKQINSHKDGKMLQIHEQCCTRKNNGKREEHNLYKTCKKQKETI